MSKATFVIALLFLSIFFLLFQRKEVEAQCYDQDIVGEWTYLIGEGGQDNTINCWVEDIGPTSTYSLSFDSQYGVVDEDGNIGTWMNMDTMGFEAVIHGRKFYLFASATVPGLGMINFPCNETLFGSSHDLLGRNWACIRAERTNPLDSLKTVKKSQPAQSRYTLNTMTLNRIYGNDKSLIAKINRVQSAWVATEYKKYNSMTYGQMLRRSGGYLNRQNFENLKPAPASASLKRMASELPRDFDWRNVSGENFVTPVRNQGDCGACYIFSSTAMLESRFAIESGKKMWLELSVQDPIDCAVYGNGCNGGEELLIHGKYAEDFGMVEESCNPYLGHNLTTCTTDSTCMRYYATGYEYVGGYFGGCNEEAMLLAVFNYGPITVGFMVFSDFEQYQSGVYSYTGNSPSFDNPDFMGLHAVLVVGFGVDPMCGKYWIVKNSWGPDWGEEGFFRIRRGVNECQLESSAAQSFPIF